MAKANKAAVAVAAETANDVAAEVTNVVATETATETASEVIATVAVRITKKQQVIDLLQNGATLAAIMQATGTGATAARSLIGDVRAAKVAVISVRDAATNVYTFWLASAFAAKQQAAAVAATEAASA